ncbi:restriction endonuclease subunit S [Vibrio parahaemolyticus]
MVPNVSLADLLDLSQYGLSVSSVENGQYPMFKMNNFRNGFMSEKGVDTVNLDETEFDKYRLEYGDILFNRTNSIDLVGKTGIFTLEGDYVFASYLVRLKVNRDIADPFYLNYFMNFDATKLRLRSLATKAVSQANINPTQLKKLLKVPLLPLSEQRKIAKILSTWDKAIATTEKLIDTSKQQKKALMQQLLTGKKRLVNPETGKAFEGEWERHAMSDLAFIDRKSLGKKTPDDFKFQYISLSDVAVGSISKELEVHKFASAPSRARRVIQEGDILLSTVRPNLKGFAKVSGNHADCIASTGFSVLTPKKSVSGDYIYQYIFSSHVTGQIDSLVVGSNYPAINSSDVAGLKVYCPTYEEQQKIASVLTTADKEIEVLEAKLDHLKDEKKALMQQLLTGKRRVKVEEMEVA